MNRLLGFRSRAARTDAVRHAGLSDELAHLHLQQRQHALHHGHLHQNQEKGHRKGADDRWQVRARSCCWFAPGSRNPQDLPLPRLQGFHPGPHRGEHRLDPHCAERPERPALRLHPVHHQLPDSAHRCRLLSGHLLQTGQRGCEFFTNTHNQQS